MTIGSVRNGIMKYRTMIMINAGLLAFLLVMIWIKPIDSLREYSIYDHPGEADKIILPVYGNIEAVQSFICTSSSDSFEIYVIPVNDDYHGTFNVRLYDSAGSTVGEWLTDKLDIVDGWVQYRLRGRVLKPHEEYRLSIVAPDLDEYGALGVEVFDRSSMVSGTGDFEYNGIEDDSEDMVAGKVMSFGVYRHRVNFFAILALVCLFTAVNISYVWKDKGADKLAWPILFASGLIMLIILAPGCGPDDMYHYYSSVTLSNKIMMRNNVDEIEKKYESDLPLHHNTNAALIETYEGLRYRINGEDGTFVFDGKKDALSWPMSHFAQAVGITLGRLLHMNFIKVYTLGRLFNLIAYVALAVLAIRLVPVNKELMLMMAMIPMSMQQATQLSYDMPVNGLSLVYIGYLIKLLHEDTKIGWKNCLCCLLLMVSITPLKVIYILLGLLLLAIPGVRFGSFGDRLVKIGIPLLGSVLTLIIVRGRDVKSNVVKKTVNAVITQPEKYRISFLLDHPIRFIRLLFSNGESHLSNMFKGMIGGSLAGFSLGIPEYLVLLFALCLIVCAVSEKQAAFKTGPQIVIVIVTVLAGYYAMLTVFAFAETIYGFPYIGGTQGRYLIPFMFPAMYCMCGRKLNTQINRMNLFIPVAFIELGYIVEVMSSIDF